MSINFILFLFFRHSNQNLKKLKKYLFFTLIEGITCYILFHILENNYFLSHVFFSIQLLFLAYFYYYLFEDLLIKKTILISVIAIQSIVISQYMIFKNSFFQINLIETTLICCFLIAIALLYVFKNLGSNSHFFYFSIGVVLYFACICLVYLSGNLNIVFIENPYIDQWVLKDLFFIVFQILILKEFLNFKKSIVVD